jgi:hypothetical protein
MFTKAIFEGMLYVRYSVKDFMVPLTPGALLAACLAVVAAAGALRQSRAATLPAYYF